MLPPIARIVAALICAVFSTAWNPAAAQTEKASGAKPAEYMIYQYPAVSLVVVINVRETEFDARISGPEGAPVSETGIAGRRIGPVYQFVEAVDTPRQLMIEVNPARRIERSRISLELLQLPESDRNARSLARAYRFLAHGMKRVYTGNTATWAERTYSLRNAAQAFASMGMEEMRLWSEYYASHLVLHELGDVLLAMERAQAVQAAAMRAGFETIELAAAALEADALMLAGEKSVDEQSFGRYDSAHESWDKVTRMADSLGYQAERGRALYQDGMAYERQGRLDRAIERYEQALEVTAAASHPDLLNEMRATAAAAYEERGSTSGAISLLDDIAGDLSQTGELSAEQELARNLYEKGRLLNRTFRYAEAAEALEQALQLQKGDPSQGQWGLSGLELGRARHARGYPEAAEAVTLESIPRTPTAERNVLARAYGTLAAIARAQGRFGRMSEYRAQQDRLQDAAPERAAFLYQSALDALAEDGPGSAGATRLLRASRQQASGSDLLSGHRASLLLCLVELQSRGVGACGLDSVRASFELLQRSGIPTVEVDSGLVWVGVLRLAGQEAEARDWADRLLNRVQFYRERLPGIITPWYGDHREELFRNYLELARAASAEDLLLALERVRLLERIRGDSAGDEDAIRSQVARVAGAQPAPGDALSRQVHGELEAFRRQSGWSADLLGRKGLREALGGLKASQAVLAWYFSETGIHAITATRKGVTAHRIGGSSQVRGRIESVRAALHTPRIEALDADLDALGRQLLAPVEKALGETVFLLSSGPLAGFPFDALRLNGQYLAQRHKVVNLDSLASLPARSPLMAEGYRERVFLAGNPRSGRDLFSYGVTSSEEISAVRDHFVGDGLHIVQGVALRSDEFEDERYGSASVIHLAMPGRVDLAWPQRSRLLLSGERDSPAADFLSPPQLRSMRLQAQLAVLSGTAFSGTPGTDFDSRIGLVNDLQLAGAKQVLASLWSVGDAEAARFMADFYRALAEEGDAAEALFQTRQSRIASKSDTNIQMWAGFQLFIR